MYREILKRLIIFIFLWANLIIPEGEKKTIRKIITAMMIALALAGIVYAFGSGTFEISRLNNPHGSFVPYSQVQILNLTQSSKYYTDKNVTVRGILVLGPDDIAGYSLMGARGSHVQLSLSCFNMGGHYRYGILNYTARGTYTGKEISCSSYIIQSS